MTGSFDTIGEVEINLDTLHPSDAHLEPVTKILQEVGEALDAMKADSCLS